VSLFEIFAVLPAMFKLIHYQGKTTISILDNKLYFSKHEAFRITGQIADDPVEDAF